MSGKMWLCRRISWDNIFVYFVNFLYLCNMIDVMLQMKELRLLNAELSDICDMFNFISLVKQRWILSLELISIDS